MGTVVATDVAVDGGASVDRGTAVSITGGVGDGVAVAGGCAGGGGTVSWATNSTTVSAVVSSTCCTSAGVLAVHAANSRISMDRQPAARPQEVRLCHLFTRRLLSVTSRFASIVWSARCLLHFPWMKSRGLHRDTPSFFLKETLCPFILDEVKEITQRYTEFLFYLCIGVPLTNCGIDRSFLREFGPVCCQVTHRSRARASGPASSRTACREADWPASARE